MIFMPLKMPNRAQFCWHQIFEFQLEERGTLYVDKTFKNKIAQHNISAKKIVV